MTAVEWLESEMLKPNLSMKDILGQAKKIEKEQKDDYAIGFANWCRIQDNNNPHRIIFTDRLLKIYKKNKI